MDRLKKSFQSMQEKQSTGMKKYHDDVKAFAKMARNVVNTDEAKRETRRERSWVNDFSYEDDDSVATEDKIRILEILPGQFDEDIVCSLWTRSISNDADYEALSYFWGIDFPDYPIYMAKNSETKKDQFTDENGGEIRRTLLIKPTLRAALRYLRYTDKSRYIWADAVCINQKNIHERNHQVGLMHKVYSSARGTILFVEEAGAGSRDMFAEFRRIAAGDEQTLIKELSREDQTSDRMPIYLSMSTILTNGWFNRLWVVQEVLLAQKAEVFCGEDSMPWKDFARAVHILGESELAPGRKMQLIDQGVFDNILALASGTLEASRVSERDPIDRFTDFLLLLRSRFATDPRDKVFGLLGLVTYPDGRQIIQTDYRKSLVQVYGDATRLILENAMSLDILGASGSTQLRDDEDGPVPSWFGDFVFRERPTKGFRHMPDSSLRSLRPELVPEPGQITVNGDLLELQGYFVDQLSEISTHLENAQMKTLDDVSEQNGIIREELIQKKDQEILDIQSEEDTNKLMKNLRLYSAYTKGAVKLGKNFSQLLVESAKVVGEATFNWSLRVADALLDWEAFAGIADPPHPVGEEEKPSDVDWRAVSQDRISPRREEYWRTLAGGSLLPGGVDLSRAAFERYFTVLESTRRLRRQGVTNDTLLHKTRTLYIQTLAQKHNHLDFPRIITHAQGRRLATTVAGHLVLVPVEAAVGDKLAYCKGARVPLLLRQRDTGSTWQFMGESYGHALADIPLENVPWEKIVVS